MFKEDTRLAPCKKFQKKILMLDRYRTPFRLMMPGNNDQYRTFLGSTFSIITLLLIMSYTTIKFSGLTDQADYSIMKAVKEDFYDPSDKFTTDHGF